MRAHARAGRLLVGARVAQPITLLLACIFQISIMVTIISWCCVKQILSSNWSRDGNFAFDFCSLGFLYCGAAHKAQFRAKIYPPYSQKYACSCSNSSSQHQFDFGPQARKRSHTRQQSQRPKQLSVRRWPTTNITEFAWFLRIDESWLSVCSMFIHEMKIDFQKLRANSTAMPAMLGTGGKVG